jgi:hypothetical protein
VVTHFPVHDGNSFIPWMKKLTWEEMHAWIITIWRNKLITINK